MASGPPGLLQESHSSNCLASFAVQTRVCSAARSIGRKGFRTVIHQNDLQVILLETAWSLVSPAGTDFLQALEALPFLSVGDVVRVRAQGYATAHHPRVLKNQYGNCAAEVHRARISSKPPREELTILSGGLAAVPVCKFEI